MYPHQRSLVEKFQGRPFAIVGVNSDDTQDDVKSILNENGITWPSFFDGGSTRGPIATAWKVNSWPTIFLIDHKGVVAAEYTRDPAGDALIEKLVGEAERKK